MKNVFRRSGSRGSGIEDDGGGALVIQAGMHVLNPASVGGRFAGESGPGGEAIEFVVVVIRFGKPVLVPHGIGDDAVEGAESTYLRGAAASDGK